MTKTMQAFVAKNKRATPQLTEIAVPKIKPNELLIKVAAASINPVDQKFATVGLLSPGTVQYPVTLGNDMAGEVVAVGSDVNDFKVGDQVYARTDHDTAGAFAEYIAINADFVAPIPTNLSLIEAASLPLVGLTAYQVLYDQLRLQSGQKLFIEGGSGGVGTVTIQIAKAMGVEVATTTSAKNMALVQELGATTVLDYHKQDYTQIIRNYDAFFDTRNQTDFAKADQILKPGGKVVSISGMPDPDFADDRQLGGFKKLMFKLLSAKAVKAAKQHQVSYHFYLMKESGTQLRELTRLVEAGKVKPIIDRTYSLAQIQSAFEYSNASHTVGKVVIEMPN